MTDIKVTCPSCSALLKLANPSLVGKKIRCPKCKGVVPVPADAASNHITTTPPAALEQQTTPVTPTALQTQPTVAEQETPAVAEKPSKKKKARRGSLLVLLFVFLLLAVPGLGVGGYFAWNWYNAKQNSKPINLVWTNAPGGDQPKGFESPDAALDAYVKALREDDQKAFQATLTLEYRAEIEQKLPQPGIHDIQARWKMWLTPSRVIDWPAAHFKRFPAEMDGADRATIVCIFESGGGDAYRKYTLVKNNGGWLVAEKSKGNAAELDLKKYVYAWNSPEPAGPFNVEEELKKATAGIDLKPLAVKVQGVELLVPAPEGAQVRTLMWGEVLIEKGDDFKLKINAGALDLKLAQERWKKREKYPLTATIAERPDCLFYKATLQAGEMKNYNLLAVNKTLGHVDFHFVTEDPLFTDYTLPQCLVMLHAARNTTLKPDYQPITSVADFERFNVKIDKDDKTGKVIGLRFGDVVCTDAMLALVAKYAPDLEHLELSGWRLTDAGLKPLATLKHLKKLGFSSETFAPLEGAGFATLAALTELESLDLLDSAITDDTLVHIKGLTRLKWLRLAGTKVTGKGLESLKGLTILEYLYLEFAKVGDDGVATLKGLTNLKALDLRHTSVTPAGAEEIKKALPNAEVKLGE